MNESEKAEEYFIQYVFCSMDRSLLRGESRPIYDKLFCMWFEVWQGLNDYVGEGKSALCGKLFKKKLLGRR